MLDLQRSAGNRAVTALVLQRKEGDGTVTRTLRQGSKGQDVKELQSALNHVDEVALALDVDGVFGPLTDKAVRQFQKSHPPLTADGIVGPLTYAQIHEASGEGQNQTELASKIYDRGATAYTAGKYGVAYDFFTKSYEMSLKPVIAFSRAQALRRLGARREEAIALFEQYIAEVPTGSRVAEATALIAELKGPGKSGDEDTDRNNAKALFTKGAERYGAKQYGQAYDLFTQADEANHKPAITFSRAQALRRLGVRREDAIALYEQYIAEEPTGSRVADATALIVELKGPGRSGDDDTDRNNAKALFNKGVQLYTAGQYGQAYDAMTEADEAYHKAAIAFSRAQALRKLGAQRELAISLYEQYLVEEPSGDRIREAAFYRDELQTQGAA